MALVKILGEATEAGDGCSASIGLCDDRLRTSGVSWYQSNFEARKKSLVAINHFEVYILEKPPNIVAGEIRMRITC